MGLLKELTFFSACSILHTKCKFQNGLNIEFMKKIKKIKHPGTLKAGAEKAGTTDPDGCTRRKRTGYNKHNHLKKGIERRVLTC